MKKFFILPSFLPSFGIKYLRIKEVSLLKFNLSIIGVAKYATPILIVNLTKK